MASSPQGPGWWQASDGGWYAPEQHPHYRPPPLQFPNGQPQYGQPQYGQPQYGQPQYGQPQYAPAAASSAPKLLAIIGIVVVLALVAGVAAVLVSRGSSTETVIMGAQPGASETGSPTDPSRSAKESAPDATSKIEIIGAEPGIQGDVTAAAIVDIDAFWTKEFPALYGAGYEPVVGGFYSWSPDEPLPPCVEDADAIRGNAFYCTDSDVVAWDDTDLIPHLFANYGDLAVAIVMAHEWAHAAEIRADMRGATVTLEQQADCFAGAWVNHVQRGDSEFFTADGPALDRALGALLEIGDVPGTSASDPNAHGSAFDRINSFQEGLESGGASCRAYDDRSVESRLVQLEFTTQADLDAGGNAPYADILELTTDDLEDYWSKVASSKYSTTWEALGEVRPFDGDRERPPACGDADTSGFSLFYCAGERFVAFDDTNFFRPLYDELGDFAIAALYGTQYSLAAQDQLGVSPEGARAQNLMADCMTGAWARSVFLGDRPETAALSMSPGDLDEAVKVLLVFGSKDEGGDQGSGFDRVKAFRDGVFEDVEYCTNGG